MLDLLLVLGRYRNKIATITALFVVLGLVTAVVSPNQYTSTAKIIRESFEGGGGIGGGLAALRGFGINLGGTSRGLTADTYPDILLSQEVLLSVARTTFYFASRDTSMQLAEYYTKYPGLWRAITGGLKKATIGLPGTILRSFRDPLPRPVMIGGEVVYASEDESKTIQRLKEQIGIRVDRTSGIIRVSFTSENPLLSARITDTLIDHLTERVRTIYSLKARENLEFIRDRFEEVKLELEEAEENLASFTDSNINPATAHLKTQLARLDRLVTFKSQLYSDLQTQFTQAQIELQRSQPVITLLEAPVPPIEKSAPNRKLLVLGSLIAGLFVSMGLAYVGGLVDSLKKNHREANKLDEVQRMFRSWLPSSWLFWKRKRSRDARFP